MTMQRRHYEIIAEILAAEKPDALHWDGEINQGFGEWRSVCRAFARKLRSTNPRFNEARFLKACGVEG